MTCQLYNEWILSSQHKEASQQNNITCRQIELQVLLVSMSWVKWVTHPTCVRLGGGNELLMRLGQYGFIANLSWVVCEFSPTGHLMRTSLWVPLIEEGSYFLTGLGPHLFNGRIGMSACSRFCRRKFRSKGDMFRHHPTHFPIYDTFTCF